MSQKSARILRQRDGSNFSTSLSPSIKRSFVSLFRAAILIAISALLLAGCGSVAPGNSGETSAANEAAETVDTASERDVELALQVEGLDTSAETTPILVRLSGEDSLGNSVSKSVSVAPDAPSAVRLATGSYSVSGDASGLASGDTVYQTIAAELVVEEGSGTQQVSLPVSIDDEATSVRAAERRAAEEAQAKAEEEAQAAQEAERQAAAEKAAAEKAAAEQAAAQAQQNERTVYITDTGKKYHRDGCQYLRQSQHAFSLDNAIAQGYEPCKKCKP